MKDYLQETHNHFGLQCLIPVILQRSLSRQKQCEKDVKSKMLTFIHLLNIFQLSRILILYDVVLYMIITSC